MKIYSEIKNGFEVVTQCDRETREDCVTCSKYENCNIKPYSEGMFFAVVFCIIFFAILFTLI